MKNIEIKTKKDLIYTVHMLNRIAMYVYGELTEKTDKQLTNDDIELFDRFYHHLNR